MRWKPTGYKQIPRVNCSEWENRHFQYGGVEYASSSLRAGTPPHSSDISAMGTKDVKILTNTISTEAAQKENLLSFTFTVEHIGIIT